MSLAKKNILFGLLFTAFTTPSVFFMMGLPMILQMQGFDASFIGLFQMVGFSAVLKFLLSPPIDRIVFRHNHYKKWIAGMGIAYIVLLLVLSRLSLEHTAVTFSLIFITVFMATWIDIPLNALAIKVFSKEERLCAGSYKMSAFFMAGLLGGGVVLLCYNRFGWENTFLMLAFFVSVALLSLFKIVESDTLSTPSSMIAFATIRSFLQQEKIGIWLFTVAFYFAFISAVWIFMKPYLIAKGIAPDDVALSVGIYGSIIGFFGGIFPSYLEKYFTKKTLLIAFSCFNALSVMMLLLMELFNFNLKVVLIAITLTALAISFSSAIIFALMMDYARQTSKAVDYAVQSSLFALTRIVSAMIAGVIVSVQNYSMFFVFELVCIVAVTFVVVRHYPSSSEVEAF